MLSPSYYSSPPLPLRTERMPARTRVSIRPSALRSGAASGTTASAGRPSARAPAKAEEEEEEVVVVHSWRT